MKGTSLLHGASLLAVALLASQAQAQQEIKLKPAQLSVIEKAVATTQTTTLTVVAHKFTGNFDSVEKNFEAFKAECVKQKVYDKMAGKASAVLILTEEPKGEFSYFIGLSTTSKVAVTAPLSIEEFRLPNAVHTTHAGPYSQLAAVHAQIKTVAMKAAPAARKNTAYPVILRLDNNPKYPNVDPRLSGTARVRALSAVKAKTEIETEVIVPLK